MKISFCFHLVNLRERNPLKDTQFFLVMASEVRPLFLLLLLLLLILPTVILPASASASTKICIVGSGISGSSFAHFLRTYWSFPNITLHLEMFEKSSVVGGRMATVVLGPGEVFEAGGTILHPKNFHALRFSELLGLRRRSVSDDGNFGIWNGIAFIFVTRPDGDSFFSKKWSTVINSLSLLWRYKWSLFRMNSYVSEALRKFLRYYDEDKPVFHTVEEMLKWADMYELTQTTAGQDLIAQGLSQELVDELITVIMRINYGQSVNISGMAGAVSLCGSGAEFWSVENGNWKMAEGLIHHSNTLLHLNNEVSSIVALDRGYELGTTLGKVTFCNSVVLATSLDESQINFSPPISIPERHSQHTYTTFVRGVINPAYFGMPSVTHVPSLIGTLEMPTIPFSSINVLKSYGEDDKAYKIFSRAPLPDDLLDELFSVRNITIPLDWAAYPHYTAPEKFAPFVLDNRHLYYINAFESAASSIETGAVAAENVARLLLSRMLDDVLEKGIQGPVTTKAEYDL